MRHESAAQVIPHSSLGNVLTKVVGDGVGDATVHFGDETFALSSYRLA